MQLTVRDLTEMFKVSEAAITRWVKQQELPAQWLAGQYRFNRDEVLDWAVAHQIEICSGLAARCVDVPPWLDLAEALEAGGIHYRVPGENREAALKAVVGRLPLPSDFDREQLLRLFLAREALGSTAIGDGIAIPHVRHPIVLHVPHVVVTVCFLQEPIAYRAPDGKPVRALFTVVSPTVATHAQFLARLARALHDPDFRTSIVAVDSREAILRHARRLGQSIPSHGGHNPRAA